MWSVAKRPLRTLLAQSHTALLAVCLLLLCLGVYLLIKSHLERSGARSLYVSAAQAVGRARPKRRLLRRREPKPLRFKGDLYAGAQEIVEQAAPLGGFAILYDMEGRVLASKLPRRRRDLGRMEPGQPFQTRYFQHRRNWWQSLTIPVKSPSGRAQLLLGRRWNSSRMMLANLVTYQAAAGALILLLGFALSRIVARRMAGPAEELSRMALGIAEGDLQRRYQSQHAPQELEELGASFNRMAERIQGTLAAQKQFVADASHELKTPLTSIGGMSEMLRAGAAEVPEDRELALNTIEREIDRMTALVNDLLTLSKAERPAVEVEVIELRKFLSESFPEAELYCPLDIKLSTSRMELHRILRNLVDNGIKYSDHSVQIEARQTPGRVEIEVRDTGIGMEPEVLERVFERFYRADPARARDTGGSGLGLAIVAALVDKLGGTIQLRSQPGEGTQAHLTLPTLETLKESQSAT